MLQVYSSTAVQLEQSKSAAAPARGEHCGSCMTCWAPGSWPINHTAPAGRHRDLPHADAIDTLYLLGVRAPACVPSGAPRDTTLVGPT